jgi:DNA processing protein
MNKTKIAILAASCLKGIGLYRINRLIESIVLSKKLKHQDIDYFELIEIGIQEQIFSEMLPISYFLEGYRKAESILEQCQQKQIHIAIPFDENFPNLLKFGHELTVHYRDCPPILFYQGDLSIFNEGECVAVIGTRSPSQEGYRANEKIASCLAQNHMTVVSGLAIGCDSAAHQGCLKMEGHTAAFLPSPIDCILPISNRQLAEDILSQGGCLLSEYPTQKDVFQVQNYHYIQRDRLQAMSSMAVVTSEFDKKSGTVHTLRYAKQYQKPVYALQSMVSSGHIPLDFFEEEGIALNLFNTPEEMIEQLKKSPIR